MLGSLEKSSCGNVEKVEVTIELSDEPIRACNFSIASFSRFSCFRPRGSTIFRRFAGFWSLNLRLTSSSELESSSDEDFKGFS